MLIGKQINCWTVLDFAPDRGSRQYLKVQCTCGTIKEVYRYAVESGGIKSCGCLRRRVTITNNTTHGMTGTRVYAIWCGMHTRCYNKRSTGYLYYGGSGIRVCPEWHTFEKFLEDMGEPPSGAEGIINRIELDRIDSGKDYAKENCRWVTKLTNLQNRK